MTITTPYCNALPPLTTEEQSALHASIAQQGVRNACLATEDGRLLDGHNRLSIDPDAPVAFLPGSAGWTDEECLAFVFRCNRERRNLSPEQKRAVRKREVDTARALREEDPQRWTQERLAEAFGVTQQAVSEWLATNTGACIGCDARVRIPATEHPTILERTQSGESQEQVASDYGVTRQAISKIVKRLQQEQPPGYCTTEAGCTVNDLHDLVKAGKKFGTIYADPPWAYDNQATRAATDNHYQTMSIEDIAALPVGELAADCCHLHLWTTNAFLWECPRLFAAWGFRYQGAFIWCKPQIGIGNCWRVAHEFLLLAIRGEPRKFRVHNLRSWEAIDRGEHSAKPEQVRLAVEKASPGPYLELFGRMAVPGWTVWGNQVSRDMFTQEIPKGVG